MQFSLQTPRQQKYTGTSKFPSAYFAGAESSNPVKQEILSSVSHRPWPLPSAPWRMTQRWNDLLFAHWPVPAASIRSLVPEELKLDTFDGSAWVGVVPFWMDQIQFRGIPRMPGAHSFPELNLRTYVRDRRTNMCGVYFFSLDATNPLAVAIARTFYRLPYYWSRMKIEERRPGDFLYTSSRLLTRKPVRFSARYHSLGASRKMAESRPGSLEYFLTERYCLFTTNRKGKVLRGNIHHAPWPLEEAEAEIDATELAAAHGFELPDTKPVLYYARELAVYIWPLELVHGSLLTVPAPVQVAKSV